MTKEFDNQVWDGSFDHASCNSALHCGLFSKVHMNCVVAVIISSLQAQIRAENVGMIHV